MKPYQRLIQNIVSKKGWSEPESLGGSDFHWKFTHIDGREAVFEADLPDAYEELMSSEGFDLFGLETEAWLAAGNKILDRCTSASKPDTVELQYNTDPEIDVITYGKEPGVWAQVTGRVWIPIESALENTQSKETE